MDGLWGVVLVIVLVAWAVYGLLRRGRVDHGGSGAGAVAKSAPASRPSDRLATATEALVDALAGYRVAHDFTVAQGSELAERSRMDSIQALIESGGLGRALVVLADELTAWSADPVSADGPPFAAEEPRSAVSDAEPGTSAWSFVFKGDRYTVSLRQAAILPVAGGVISRVIELSWRGDPVLAIQVDQSGEVDFGPRRSFRVIRFVPGAWMGGLVAIESQINFGRERLRRADRGELLRA